MLSKIVFVKNNKGFTLIELLIVVAIIGILAAVGAAVITSGLLGNAKQINCKLSFCKYKSTIRNCSLLNVKLLTIQKFLGNFDCNASTGPTTKSG